jgi:ribosome-associated translation inhibitor RaiA
MTLPLQLTFRNMKHSAEVEDWVRSEAAKLETFYHRILGCRVAIEVPHRHHRKGKSLHVRIDLTLPGKEIVVKREPVAFRRKLSAGASDSSVRTRAKSPNAELELAIHDAFKSAGRRVQDFARRQRGDVKRHQEVSLTA